MFFQLIFWVFIRILEIEKVEKESQIILRTGKTVLCASVFSCWCVPLFRSGGWLVRKVLSTWSLSVSPRHEALVLCPTMSFFSPFISRCYYALFNVCKLLLIVWIAFWYNNYHLTTLLLMLLMAYGVFWHRDSCMENFCDLCNPSGQYYEANCLW